MRRDTAQMLAVGALCATIATWGVTSLAVSMAEGQDVGVPALIVDAAERHGVSSDAMLSIAWCESRFRPAVVAWDGSMGLFQFQWITWRWASVEAGYGGYSPLDAEANANTAAYLLSLGQWSHWRACW